MMGPVGKSSVVRCTTRATDTLTVVRGLDDTTASAFNAGDKLELRVTKILMDDIQEDAADEAMAMAIALGQKVKNGY